MRKPKPPPGKTATQVLIAILVGAFLAALTLLWYKHAYALHEEVVCREGWCAIREERLDVIIKAVVEDQALLLCGWTK